MAIYSTGISVTFDGTAFTEVVGLSWTYGGGPSKGRSASWTDDAGSCTVETLGSANTSINNYGKRAQLEISGGGQSLTTYAVWESLGVSSEVNGVTRFTVSFKLLDN